MTVRQGQDSPDPGKARPRDPNRVPGALPFRVAVTRPDTGDDRFEGALEARGLTPVGHPLLRIVPPADATPLARMAAELVGGGGRVGGPGGPKGEDGLRGEEGRRRPWLLVTSRQALPPLGDALSALGAGPLDVRASGVRVAAVGSATAEALEAWGLPPEVVPDRYTGDDLLETLVAACGGAGGGLEGERFLFPRAERARELLPDGLRARGAEVELVTAYRIVPHPEAAARLWSAVTREELDAVTFTSGSALRTLARVVPARGVWPSSVRVAVIGPVTAAAADGTAVPVHITPPEYTLEALAEAVTRFASSHPSTKDMDP